MISIVVGKPVGCSLRAVAGAMLFLAFAPAGAGEFGRHGSVYCVHNNTGTRVFAGEVKKDGRLSFGISIWLSNGRQIGVFGIAARHRHRWEYTNNLSASKAIDRCRLNIVLRADKTLYLAADPNATCQAWGGYGTMIGHVRFSPSAYEGPVTVELNDSENFFGKAGRCWK